MKFLAGLFALIVLSGCAAIGPSDSPEFGSLVARSVPAESGAILIYDTGTWQPNTRGFTGVMSGMLAPPQTPIPGVIVITENALIVSQWDKPTASYVPMKRILISNIDSVRVDKFGLSSAIVVQQRDLSVDTFTFTKASGNFVNAARAEEAAVVLQKLLR
jgi:hypothetical protein